MRRSVPLVVAVLLLAAAPAARAETVTLGASLAAPSTQGCAAACTASPTTLTGRQLVAPFRGIITSWRIRAGATVAAARLVVVRRPTGPGGASDVLVRSPAHTPAVNSTSPDVFVRMPISAGEYIGLETAGPADFFAAEGQSDVWEPPLGETGIAPTQAAAGFVPNISVTIETDLDGDGTPDSSDGDTDGDGVPNTSDGCPTVAAPGGCPAPPQPAPRVNAPPTVRFVTPVAATTVGTAQAIDLEVSDDAGSPRVTVHDDDGTICTLTAAPYSCIWTPTGADVGRATLLASATDSDGRTTLGIVRVTVPRFAATLTRRRSGRRVTGRLRLPAAVEPTLGCRGTVTVRRGKAKRTAALKPNCTYAVRLPKKTSGAVKARFGGNPVVLPT